MYLTNFLLLITTQVLSAPVKDELYTTSTNLVVTPIRYIVVQEPQKFYLEPIYQSNELLSTQRGFKLQKRNEVHSHEVKEKAKENQNEEINMGTSPSEAVIDPSQLVVGEFNNPSELKAEESVPIGTSPAEPWGWGGRGWGGRGWGWRGRWGWGGRWGGGWGGPWGGYY